VVGHCAGCDASALAIVDTCTGCGTSPRSDSRSPRVVSSVAVRQRWLWIIVGPALFLLIGSAIALFLVPHPIPRTATPVQRAYLGLCAECHGANGQGSWRATFLGIHPGHLSDPQTLRGRSDDFLFNLIKHGGAPIGKPGMPAFGFHLSDEQIRELVRYVRALPGRR
jgi:cytochrome c553